VPLMNAGRYTFVLDIPPNFERDVLRGRKPAIQLNVDATAMVQAGLGSGDAQQIIMNEIQEFLSHSEHVPLSPVNLATRIEYNPNLTTAWFTSVMGIINNITMLVIILAGAAVVREREHGTMDHLLVMPLTPFEIAMSKIWANALVITVAAGLTLYLVVRTLFGRADHRINSVIHARHSDLSVLRMCDRHFYSHDCAVNAAAWTSVHAGLSSNEHAVRQ
jgi:ABC-2 type transport system permease protein